MPRRTAESLTPAERIDRFLLRVEELRSRRLIPDKLTVSLTVTGDGRRVRPILGTVDEEDLRSLLVAFRLFISNDEPVFMNKVFNLCQRHLTDDTIRQQVAEARTQWNALGCRVGLQARGDVTVKVEQPTWHWLGLSNPAMPDVPPAMAIEQPVEVSLSVESKGVTVTWEHATALIINTTFHDDAERVAVFDALSAEEQILVHAIFRFYLAGALACILWLGNTVRVAKERGLFDWQGTAVVSRD